MLKTFIALVIFGCSLMAQTKTIPVPTCTIAFTLTSATNTASYDNRQQQCTYWAVGYASHGFTVLRLTLQGADDNNGTAGTFGTYVGTVSLGINPSTSITSAYFSISPTATYNPWVRVLLDNLTGAGGVTGVAYGWTVNPSPTGGTVTVSCGATGCVVIGPDAQGAAPTQNPVQVAGIDGSGNVYRLQVCTLSAVVSSSATSSVLISGVASKKIRICRLVLTPASAINLTLVQGTGVTCGTGTAGLSGQFQQITSIDTYDAWSPLIANTAQDVCMLLSSGVATTGTVIYALN